MRIWLGSSSRTRLKNRINRQKIFEMLRIGRVILLLAGLSALVGAREAAVPELCDGWGLSETMCLMSLDIRSGFANGDSDSPFTIYAPFFYELDFTSSSTTELIGQEGNFELYAYYVLIKGGAGVEASMRGSNITIVANYIEVRSDGDFTINLNGVDRSQAVQPIPAKAPTPPQKPAGGGRGTFGARGIPGQDGENGHDAGNFVMVAKHLNLTSLHEGGYQMKIAASGTDGADGVNGGPGGDGGKGAEGVGCNQSTSASKSSCGKSWCKNCPKPPSNAPSGYAAVCTLHSAGSPGNGGAGGAGGRGGDAGRAGRVRIYSNSVSGSGDEALSEEQARSLLSYESVNGKEGRGAQGGAGGTGPYQPNCTVYMELLIVLNSKRWSFTSRTPITFPAFVRQGATGAAGADGRDGNPADEQPSFVRLTSGAPVDPDDDNVGENPQDWAYLTHTKPAEYLDFGLQQIKMMLDMMMFNQDNEQNQVAYNLILAFVAEIMANAQVSYENATEDAEQNKFLTYLSQSSNIFQTANQMSSPSGQPLGDISVLSFETLLGNLEQNRQLGESIEEYYDAFRNSVLDAELSAQLLANATEQANTGIKAQTSKQEDIYGSLLQLNETLFDTAAKIEKYRQQMEDNQASIDQCWAKVQERMRFQRIMQLVGLALNVVDGFFGSLKAINTITSIPEAASTAQTFFEGVKGIKDVPFEKIPGWADSFTQYIPSAGDSNPWANFDPSSAIVANDLPSLSNFQGQLSDPLLNLYNAAEYDDAVDIAEKIGVVDQDLQSAKINLSRQELDNYVDYMKQYCYSEATALLTSFDNMQMWVDQRNNVLNVYSAYMKLLQQVTATKMYLQSVVAETQHALQEGLINPAAPAVANAQEATYKMIIQDFNRDLFNVIAARDYLMMGLPSDGDKVALSNCVWEASIIDLDSKLFFKCSASALLSLEQDLQSWYADIFTDQLSLKYGSYWGPVNLNETTVGEDNWTTFLETGVINFCVDPTEPAFNRRPAPANNALMFPLASIDEVYVVFDGVGEEVSPTIDITLLGESGVMRVMENDDEEFEFLTRKFTHANLKRRFIYFGEAPEDDEETIKEWMRGPRISQNAEFSSDNTIRVSPFSNYKLETQVSSTSGVSNVRVYFTGEYVLGDLDRVLDATHPMLCSSRGEAREPVEAGLVSAERASQQRAPETIRKGHVKCDSYGISAKVIEDHKRVDGSSTKVCEVQFETKDEGDRLPSRIELAWTWRDQPKKLFWEHSEDVVMSFTRKAAVAIFNHNAIGTALKSSTRAESDSCPTEVRIVSVDGAIC